MSENKKISLIVPVYYEEEVLPIAYPRMKAALEQTGYDHEIIFVNDGSRDGTMKVLRKIASEDKQVKVLSFSRNFGHQLAWLSPQAWTKRQATPSSSSMRICRTRPS